MDSNLNEMSPEQAKVSEQVGKLLAARGEYYALFDKIIPKRGNSDTFDFDALGENSNLKDIYARFYAYDYEIRKLLPHVYKKFGVKFNV